MASVMLTLMCILDWTRRMTSTGQGLPAMMPVRRLSRRYSPKLCGWRAGVNFQEKGTLWGHLDAPRKRQTPASRQHGLCLTDCIRPSRLT